MNDAPPEYTDDEAANALRRESSVLRWMGAGVALVVVGVLVVVAALIVVRRADSGPAAPSIRERTTLRATASDEGTPIATLEPGTAIRLLGRSVDERWLVAQLPGVDGRVGWVAAGTVGHPGDIHALTVVDTGSVPATSAPAANGPDRPDLVVRALTSRQNELWVTVANVGTADATGPIEVAINDGTRHRVDVGKPLRPGEQLDARLTGEYVQFRAQVDVTVFGPPNLSERDTANNKHEFTVAPDQPNDLEILRVVNAAGDGHLIVTVRNNSPIPIVGSATVTIRQAGAGGQALAIQQQPLDLPPQAAVDVPFADLKNQDLTKIQALLSTDAIVDASQTNNVYPR